MEKSNIGVMGYILSPEKLEAIIPLIEENLKILNGLINRYDREDLK